ncbi:hypothetical protein [Pseudoteredinibacter isoporae]|uniref:Uncharacterized protein n=1 Tax=Pseudoteredinibacter isoporae TaxID=570281 RepID=A0A7X0MX31_9GAMM|nr:hypothetical protein [Pseudoteredinibacter isoporae]MBB6523053.1 hypothetical protein [Pseudoteredinibacter isoporae]NHO88573.1 hypothetical protein [Pseudoteredinibacter isoporae]NIB22736.1 hypothetical protein [Pseudoteredinibacter isoporae]
MKQPLLGLISTLTVMALAFAIIALSEHSFFMGWLSFAVMACIPTQIISAFVWGPLFEHMSPLKKGLSQTAISLLGGMIFGALLHFVAGQGFGPTPQLMMLTIVTVIATFWLMVAWNAWPFAAVIQSPIPLGIAILLGAYLLAYLVFSLAFNYEFLALAPIYIESLDPKGLFSAWPALAFLVTTVAVIMLCLLLDFYPLSQRQLSGAKAALANSAWILLLAGIVFYLGVYIVKIDPVVYMVRGPVSFIFGAFILLNLLENSLLSGSRQPIRGICLGLLAAGLAGLMQVIYQCFAQHLNPEIAAGPAEYQLELWLANAMLAITFPLIVVMTDFFGQWPLKSNASDADSQNSHQE